MWRFLLILACIGILADVSALIGSARQGVRPTSSMSLMARLPLIAGNWKMNTDLASAVALAKEVVELTKSVDPNKVEIMLAPPFPFLYEVSKIIKDSPQKIQLGAQNCFYETSGAFTGATSASMIKSVGCSYSLVGHSERRKIFKEQDGDINHSTSAVGCLLKILAPGTSRCDPTPRP